MTNKVIENMNSEEIINAIVKIDEQLEEIKQIYTPFVGMKFERMPTETVETIRNLLITVEKLTIARAELRYVASNNFGIFVV